MLLEFGKLGNILLTQPVMLYATNVFRFPQVSGDKYNPAKEHPDIIRIWNAC